MEHSIAVAEEARANLRKRFREWAFSFSERLVGLGGPLLILLDEDGTIIACERIAADDRGSFVPNARPGIRWADAVCGGDDALSRSLASRQYEKTHHTAAAPIAITVHGKRFWFGLYTSRPAEADPADIFLELISSLDLEFAHMAGACSPERLRLIDMMRSFQGQAGAGEVVNKTVNWLDLRFPGERYELLLAQDIENVCDPVKPLAIRCTNTDLCSKAFIEGRLQIVAAGDGNEGMAIREMAAPLRGNQGIYGIIHIISFRNRLDENDAAFVAMLAENAGNALEFARLYEQSTARVRELRIINEITKRLNRSLQIGEVLQFATNELVSTFSAEYCFLLQVDKAKRHMVVKASNAETLVNEKFDIHYGFAGIIYRSKEPVIIRDYAALKKPVESKLMDVTYSRSLIGSPVIANGETVGAIMLVHRRPGFFSYDKFRLLQVISEHIGLALTNANLHAEMRRMVITDQLTGLYVRHYLYEQIRLLQKKEACGALVVVDIDNFKLINDTFGHQAGDKVLIQIAKIITRNIRESDIAARWGGEELAVYLPYMDIQQAYKVADRIRHAVASETLPQVTISCGVAGWRRAENCISVDTLFHRADMALYTAKNSGKNQIRLYRA